MPYLVGVWLYTIRQPSYPKIIATRLTTSLCEDKGSGQRSVTEPAGGSNSSLDPIVAWNACMQSGPDPGCTSSEAQFTAILPKLFVDMLLVLQASYWDRRSGETHLTFQPYCLRVRSTILDGQKGPEKLSTHSRGTRMGSRWVGPPRPESQNDKARWV